MANNNQPKEFKDFSLCAFIVIVVCRSANSETSAGHTQREEREKTQNNFCSFSDSEERENSILLKERKKERKITWFGPVNSPFQIIVITITVRGASDYYY